MKRLGRFARLLALVPALALSAPVAAHASPDAPRQVEVSGSGCTPGSTVVIEVSGQSFATTAADARGAFAATVAVPADIREPTVTALCGPHSFLVHLARVDAGTDRSYVAQGLLAGGAAAIVAVLITLLRRRGQQVRREQADAPASSATDPTGVAAS